MQIDERCKEIYRILKEKHSVTIHYLQKCLFASEPTVRRDLALMEEKGLLVRVWGGAMLAEQAGKDPPWFVRMNENKEKKVIIAKIATTLIHDSYSLFIDSSTTCMHLIRNLQRFKQLTIITNGLETARLASENTTANIYLLGGQLFEGVDTGGPQTTHNIAQFRADICFFSCTGISVKDGIMGTDMTRVEAYRSMCSHSQKARAAL